MTLNVKLFGGYIEIDGNEIFYRELTVHKYANQCGFILEFDHKQIASNVYHLLLDDAPVGITLASELVFINSENPLFEILKAQFIEFYDGSLYFKSSIQTLKNHKVG